MCSIDDLDMVKRKISFLAGNQILVVQLTGRSRSSLSVYISATNGCHGFSGDVCARSAIHLTETENNPKREGWRVWKTYVEQEHQADTVPENIR